MKIGKKCKKEYLNKEDVCTKCGSKLYHIHDKKETDTKEIIIINKNSVGDIIRYFFGVLIIIGSLDDLIDEFYTVVSAPLAGIAFGISLLPILYKKLYYTNMRVGFVKAFQIILPIIFGIIWVLLLD